MKVLLANPPPVNSVQFIREGRCMQTKDSWATIWPPLSLMTIAAFLRKNGHQVILRDFSTDKEDYDKVEAVLRETKPEAVIINTAFPSIKNDLKMATVAKKALPDVMTITVGMFPSVVPEETLRLNSDIDYAVVGEPEWVVRDVLEGKKPNGLAYRENGNIKVTPPQDNTIHSLDNLPFPARDLIDNKKHRMPINNRPFTLINLGRGCHHPCTYCIASNYYGKKFRKRDVSLVIDEIKECIDKYGIRDFLFWEESFTLDRAYGEEICDRIIAANLDISWSTTTRVDTIDLLLLKKMKKAGCFMLGLGIESVNDDVRKNIRKHTTMEQINSAIDMCEEAGIRSMGHFIFGLPGETYETSQEMIQYALKSKLNYAQFYCAIPYPGTEFGKTCEDSGWIETHDYSQYELTKSVCGNGILTAKQIKKLRDTAYRKFYYRPKMVRQALKEVDSVKSLVTSMGFMKWINKAD